MPATIQKRVWTSRYLRSTIFRLIDCGIKNTDIITELRTALRFDRVRKHLDKMLIFNASTGLWKFRPENVVKNVDKIFDLYTIESFRSAPQNRAFKKGDKVKVEDCISKTMTMYKDKVFDIAKVKRKKDGTREIYTEQDSFPYSWFPPEHIVKVS